MAYIDSNDLFKCETCRRYNRYKCLAWSKNGECYSPNMKKIPTADVVPKSEVEALQREIARLEKALRNSLPSYCQVMAEKQMMEIGKAYGRREVAREIFEEIEKISMQGTTPFGLCLMSIGVAVFAKLKEKYTEGGDKDDTSVGN